MAPEAPALETFLGNKERLRGARLELDKDSAAGGPVKELVTQLRAALPAALPGELSEERFRVPDSPYVVDFALEGPKALLIVPRPEHRAAGSSQQLSGRGQLMEKTLEAMGWRTCWMWPEEWSPKLLSTPEDEVKEAFQNLLGKP
ncbi:unnamed protein product [Polarella glacialis]|uniref:RAP domain-containing protein n=2 Tax=Polarella glacialis TaxID=89957 RepID=A0A813IZR6_POLGL|nr:unnamed protein product [Polarella glacialis]